METQEIENKEMALINQMFTSLGKDEDFNNNLEIAKMFLQVDDKTLGDINQILQHFLIIISFTYTYGWRIGGFFSI